MSFRIEQADPLALMQELPDEWAQTCVTSPRRDAPVPYLLAVLDQVHRVLRHDGTLWLALTRGGNAHELKRALRDTRWLQPLPATGTPRHCCCSPSNRRSSLNLSAQPRESSHHKAPPTPGIR